MKNEDLTDYTRENISIFIKNLVKHDENHQTYGVRLEIELAKIWGVIPDN